LDDVDQDGNVDEFQTLFKASPYIPNYCVSFSTKGIDCINGSPPDIAEFLIKCFASSDIDDCVTLGQVSGNTYATGLISEEIGSSLVIDFEEFTVDLPFTPVQDYRHILIYPEVPSSDGHTATSITNVSVTCNHTALNDITTFMEDCELNTYSFKAIIDGDHPIAEYAWDFGDGTTSIVEFPVHSYTVDGIYEICLSTKDIYGCCGEKCITVSVPCETTALAGITYTAGDRLVRFTVENASSDDFASIEWDFGDGNISTELNPLHLYAEYDTYDVCVSITDINGCCATVCETIDIPTPPLFCTCNIPIGSLYLDGNNPDTDQLSDFTTSGVLIDGDMFQGIDIYISTVLSKWMLILLLMIVIFIL
jgi:hypothetical protein